MLFDWVLLVLVNVSTFNMLPLYPLDGDAYVWSIIERHSVRAAKIVRIVLSVVCLSILASNVGLTFMRYGLTLI
jgi:membrane-associated protease RseP (regulator of RpoE activity)